VLVDNTVGVSTSDTSNAKGSVLFLSPSLWPEPSSSAAGVRTSSLLQHFATATSASSASSIFSSVHYGSGAPKPSSLTEYARLHNLSTEYGIRLHTIPANRSDAIEGIILASNEFKDLSAVVFDRYFAEEAYSFHFWKHKESVIRILDMQDMHSLRLARQALVGDTSTSARMGDGFWMDDKLMERVMECMPFHFENESQQHATNASKQEIKKRKKDPRDILLRELASIHRSDLVLVCSSHEYDLLTNVFGIDSSKLCMAPFFSSECSPAYDSPDCQYEQRSDFVALGGYRHPPNVDSVKWLKAEVWPRIRSQLPEAKLHVWGSYPPQHIMQLNDSKSGFLVKGRLDNLAEELAKRRILLAPLRYGAGIKGKVVDAWSHGCPVVTTPVGAEGTKSNRDILTNCSVRGNVGDIDDVGWGGLVGTDADVLARCAVRLYRDQGLWDESRRNARRLLRMLFDEKRNLNAVSNAISEAVYDKVTRRSEDHISAILWHQSNRSTEYFSRWIELKEKPR